MKSLSFIFIFIFIFSLNAFSQVDLIEKYESSFSNLRVRNGVDIKEINSVLSLAKKLADFHRLQYQEITLYDRKGNSYPALRFLAEPYSLVGKEVQTLISSYGDLRLVLSPYDLKRSGANAFFNPDGSTIGAPKEIAYNQLNESYYHEKIHATTYRDLIVNNSDTFIGYYKLIKGERMGLSDHGGYFRHASMDEMKATEFSTVESVKKLYDVYLKTPSKEFYSDRKNEELLSEVQFNLKNLIGLSKQSLEVLTKVKEKIKKNDRDIRRESLSLGDNLQSNIFEIKVLVSSVERVFENGRGQNKDIENGVEVLFRSNSSSNDHLLKRIEAISASSQKVLDKYPSALKLIGTRIVYADLKKTDIKALYNAIVK